MIINYSINSFNITIIDFLVIFVVEVFFFNFSMNKLKFRDSIGTIAIADLIKVGFLSLFISWLPFYYNYTFNTVVLFTVLLLLSGVVISTIMFQKEFLFSKNEAFNLAFQLSVLSSSAFFLIKVFLTPTYIYFGPMIASSSSNTASTATSFNILNFFPSIGGNGLLFLILGVGLFFYFNKNKTKELKPINEKMK